MLSDYHVHTGFSDGVGGVEASVRRAAELGLAEVGISDHFVPAAYDPEGCRLPAEHLGEYVAEVRAAAARYPDVTVLAGLEVDYIADTALETLALLEPLGFDYLIGSVHFIDGWAFDLDDGLTDPRWKDLDGLYGRYYAIVAEAAARRRFTVMGPLDLPKQFGARAGDPVSAAAAALAAIAASGAALELNTSGLYTAGGEAYPAPELLKAARRLGIPLVFGSDAHTPEEVGRDFEGAVALARAAGYDATLRLSDHVTVPLP
jgi:histidinol-phosphatase (PHP family)